MHVTLTGLVFIPL